MEDLGAQENKNKCVYLIRENVYSISGMLAEVIRRITVKHSLGSIFVFNKIFSNVTQQLNITFKNGRNTKL